MVIDLLSPSLSRGDVLLLGYADFRGAGVVPFYIGISAGAAPLFRRRSRREVQSRRRDQAFLVESVTGRRA